MEHTVGIGIDVRDTGGGLATIRNLNTALRSLGPTATGSIGQVNAAFARMSTAQKALGVAGVSVAALALGLKAAISPAIEFESSFAGVLKTVDGTTGQLDGIRTGILNMSTVMPVAATQLADIAANAGQLGVQAPKVLAFTETIAKLGATTDLDFEAAAQSLARFQNITGNTAPIQRIGDVIVELGNNSATTESQIVTFATRLAAGLSTLGASEDQILALGSGFSSLGIEAEAGSTAIVTAMTRIADAAILGGQELSVFASTAGLTNSQFSELAKNAPVEAFLLFAEGLGRVTAEGRSITPILESVDLQGIRTTRTLQLAALGSDQLRTALALANEQFTEGGAAQEEYARRVETTSARLEIFRNRLQFVAIAAGTPALGALAATVDALGDGILSLSDSLAPLGREMVSTFDGIGQAAARAYDVVGGPTLTTISATVELTAASLAALLGALNALGTAGQLGAVGLGLVAFEVFRVGPASVALNSALVATRASLAAVGVSGTAAAAGLRAANLAAAAGPYVALAAVVAAAALELRQAKNAASEARAEFEKKIELRIETGSVGQLDQEIDNIVRRMEELRTVAADTEGVDFWTRFGRAVKGTGEILTPFTDNTVANANAELRALNGSLEDGAWGNFSSSVEAAASVLGVSNKTIIETAQNQGVLAQLTNGTTAEFYAAVDAISEVTGAVGAFDDESQRFQDSLAAGTASFSQIAEAIGVTEDGLARLANLLPDVDFNDLLGGEGQASAAAKVQALNEELSALAGTAGLTSDEFTAQLESLDRLTASYSTLESAIRETIDAMALLDSSQARLTEAQNAYSEAAERAASAGTDEAFREAAAAAAELVLSLAATGEGFAGVEDQQRSLITELANMAAQSGRTRDEVADLLSTLTALPPATILEIIAEADKFNEEVDAVEERRQELEAETIDLLFEAETDAALSAMDALGQQAEQLSIQEFPITVTADTEDPRDALDELDNTLATLVDGAYEIQTEYDPDDTNRKLGEVLSELDLLEEVRSITVDYDDALAREKNSALEQAIRDTVDGSYVANPDVDILRAQAKTAEAARVLRAWADDQYLALLEGDNTDAVSETLAAKRLADDFAGEYRATLTATDNASSVIGGAVSALSGFVSKSITLTTTNLVRNAVENISSGSPPPRSSPPPPPPRPSPSRPPANFNVFAHGGIVEPAGRAQIYSSAPTFRIHSEPETGGEGYVPLAQSKRATSIPVWRKIGEILGELPRAGTVAAFNNGGIVPPSRAPVTVAQVPNVTNIVLRPSVSLTVQGDSTSGSEVAQMVGVEVDRVMRQLATDIELMRN